MAKIFFFLVVPLLALYATIRVGMTAIGMDVVHWAQWPEKFFGIGGINLAVPIFILLMLGRAKVVVPVWDFIRSAPREYAALLRLAGAKRLTLAILLLLAGGVLPIIAVWLFPEVWTHWRTWLAVGLVPCLPALWHRLFRSESKWDGVLGAIATIVACTLATMVVHGMYLRDGGMHWIAPFMSVSMPFVAGMIAGDLPRHIRETRMARRGQSAA